jgi:hypothetical protein
MKAQHGIGMPLPGFQGAKRTEEPDISACPLDLSDRASYNPGRQLERIAWRQCKKSSG